jgi:hypothetical protein
MSAVRLRPLPRAVGLALLLASGALAAPPDAPRIPQPRPDTTAALGAPAAENAATAKPQSARLPRPRPATSARLAMLTPNEEIRPPMVPVPPPPRAIEPPDTACLARLRALGVAFEEEAPIDSNGLCFVDHPLAVTSLGSGVALAPEAIMNCRTAEALALWIKDVVLPAARSELGAAPTGIAQVSTYVCRPRNNVAGATLSEHAHANAIDISSIEFAGRQAFTAGAPAMTAADAAFQAAIGKGACGYFTTVLGPGSDAEHATHFHLDMAERRGGYRLCELGEANTARAR